LARAGFDLEQLPRSTKARSPDFKIEGRVFDNYSPTAARPRNIWANLNEDKVNPRGRPPQARRIVLNLSDTPVELSDLRAQFRNYPMPNLEEVIAITGEGEIVHIWP